MNDIVTNRRLIPQRAIIVYHTNGEYNKDYYLESREIVKKGERFAMMAPVPLARKTMQRIAGSFILANALEMDFGGLLAEHMLYGLNKPGLTFVIWYRPAMTRSLNFSSSLAIKGAHNVQIPATLYAVVNTKLYIFALTDNARPIQGTKLYRAPFFNIYEDGNVCLGTAPIGKAKGKTFEKEAERFERGFYMAEQNGGDRAGCKTSLTKLWPRLIKEKLPFPSKKELLQHPKFRTLGEFIQKMAGNIDKNEG